MNARAAAGPALAGLALGGLLLTGTAVAHVVSASPASAHAELASSDPAAGTRVAALPDLATLTFTEAVGQPAALTVTGPDGTDVASGSVDVVDRVLSRPLDTGPPLVRGTYTMSYQVTSADGHPISGTVDFTLTTGRDAQASDPVPAAGTDDGVGTGVVIGLVLGVLVALGVAAVSIGRLVGRAPDA